MRSFIAIFKGGVADEITVCAGPALLYSGLRWSPNLDELLWFL